MSFRLYDATVPVFRQTLGAMTHLLDKAEAWSAADGPGEADVVAARLVPDMLPFAYQVKSTAVHSLGAIEGVRRGQFSPDTTEPPSSYAALKAQVKATDDALAALDPAEIDSFLGREMCFVMGDIRMEFQSAEAFLMGFSLPNFFFHATTAYDLLRMKGLKIGKIDFLPRLPLKR